MLSMMDPNDGVVVPSCPQGCGEEIGGGTNYVQVETRKSVTLMFLLYLGKEKENCSICLHLESRKSMEQVILQSLKNEILSFKSQNLVAK
jgi:hypothetical protein